MKDLPYKVTTMKLGLDAGDWCREHIGDRWFAIGRRTGDWTCFWAGRDNPKHYYWHFRHSDDATMFALRWS